MKFGDKQSWKLIEKLAADIADMVLAEFKPAAVSVEVKKFIIPQARFISVALTRAAELKTRPSIVSNFQPDLSATIFTAPEVRV